MMPTSASQLAQYQVTALSIFSRQMMNPVIAVQFVVDHVRASAGTTIPA
jgi:hypothetical protein